MERGKTVQSGQRKARSYFDYQTNKLKRTVRTGTDKKTEKGTSTQYRERNKKMPRQKMNISNQ